MKENKLWFQEVVEQSEHIGRISDVLDNKRYLNGSHKVLNRKDFEFKEETFTTSKIVLNTLKTVIEFHSSLIVGKPVSVVGGNPEIINIFNQLYRESGYNKLNYDIVKSLYSYGDVFEYVYREGDKIKSKLISSADSYPVYDTQGNYVSFVEYWTDILTSSEYYVVYTPEMVEEWDNEGTGVLVKKASYSNSSGLPIHYSNSENYNYEYYGRSILEDLKPIVDEIEMLLSKMNDSITTLSLNPLFTVSGQKVDSQIDSGLVGTILNLEDGAEGKYQSANLDSASIKLLLDNLLSQLYTIAGVPSSIIGQSNVSNVSEVSLELLFRLAINKARATEHILHEGYQIRHDYIMKLLGLKLEKGEYVDVVFNYDLPVDNGETMDNMKTQYDMGAISTETIISNSPYTNDVALEMDRLKSDKVI
jgi:SPP1 family phage portal protein